VLTCYECHNSGTTTTFALHNNGTANVIWTNTSTANANGVTPSWNSVAKSCSVYCHGVSMPRGDTSGSARTPAWTNAALMTGTASNDCRLCHGNPPTTGTSSSSHTGQAATTSCATCHQHFTTAGGFSTETNRRLHIDGTVQVSGGTCIGCHDTPQGTRSAITTEFGLAWGHKKSGRTAVTDSDCIVCHLEGTFATQGTSGLHGNGNIDLRDPDGAGETAITNNSGGAFTFTKYAISYAAGSRTTTVGNTVAEVINLKFCMKCHDANGATNTTARTRNATNTATTGTQYSPFEGINLGATYTTTNGAAATGGVVNVASQFASNNSSRHPVGAPNSRAYPYSTRLAAPYNGIGTTRDANTQTGNSASPRVKANSVIIYCEDCHTSGTTLLTRTVTAHGGATGYRGTYYTTNPSLCTACHTGTYADTANGRHNTGSAFAVGTTRVASSMTNCNVCHFSTTSTGAARPIKAYDIHGFNGMLATGAGWSGGAASGMRPIAFMRNVVTWPGTVSPRPYTATTTGSLNQINLAAGQSTCGGTVTLGGSCGNEGHTNYSPGGSY
jgi:predicted CxxxxCH...CXXCH cytochrome family protein